MSRKNECDVSREEIVVIALVLFAIALNACSTHTGDVKSAEKSVAVAKKNDDLAKAAVMMRVSDYGQEARYGVSLLPKTSEANAIGEILALQIQLAGKGSLAEQDRELFVQKLIRAGADAQLALANAANTDIKLEKALAEKDAQLVDKSAKLDKVATQAATVADEADKWLHYFFYILIAAFIYFAARLALLWSQTAATVAAKVP